ncbi:MAG: hypothetical protein K2M91_06985 [Lachnospiraceae bacterium]|nr:hypothetical protein [Lachnospiraceae bacterium]
MKRVVYIIFILVAFLFLTSFKVHAENQRGIIFVGESHISIASASVTPSQGGDNTLAGYVLDNTLFFVFENNSDVGKVEWLRDTALDNVRGILDSHEDISEWSIIIQHGATESMYPERWDKYISVWQQFKDSFPDSRVYVLSIPPLPDDGRYWDEWVRTNSLSEPFSVHNNENVRKFNNFCKKNCPVKYLDFDAAFKDGQAMEGSGSSLDTSDTIDPNHYAPSVYRSVLTGVAEKISSIDEVDDNPVVVSSDSSSGDRDRGLMGYCKRFIKWICNI